MARNRENQIAWLAEVETGEGKKAVAGAAILADVCIEKMKVKGKLRPGFLRCGAS
jgi:hypothetical protein